MTTQLQTAKILIVEDEKSIRDIYELILSSEGYRVSCASNGLAALSLIKRDLPDLVLLDLMMPGLSGAETIKQLRSIAETKNLPVVILTNVGKNEVPQEIIDSNVMDVLVKVELAPNELIEKVQKSLARQLY